MTKNLKNQINLMINKNETLINIINFLFTCDYDTNEIINILTSKHFNCRKELLIDTFIDDFGMSPLFEY